LGLPGASVPVIAVFAFDTTSGAVAIAPLLGDPFTPRQAVATMLVGVRKSPVIFEPIRTHGF
jgi:hypothetical protein